MFKKGDQISDILLESISEGVIIVDNHQNIAQVNAASENIFGYEKGELISRNLNVLLPSNYHKILSKRFTEFFKTGTRTRITDSKNIYGIKKNGNIIELDIELIPFAIYNKNFVMALISDITEQKELERKLVIKSKALESANNGIIITDALKHDNPIIYFNPAFQDLTGYDSNEILNHNFRFLYGSDTNQEPLENVRKAIKNGESCQAILRNYKKDGTLFYSNLFIIPITDVEGLVVNFIIIQTDVTEKIQKEEELGHLSKIFNESINEIHVFDAKTLKFINVNQSAQDNLGYTLEELTNMTPIDITPYKDEADLRADIDVLLKKNVDKLVVETVHTKKDGNSYPVETHLQISNFGGREVFVAIVLDITDRKNHTKKLEKIIEERTQQLEHALSKEKEVNHLKNKFLSLLSHEFKTPLSAILTSALLLSKYNLTEQQDKRDKHIKTIAEKANLLNTILNGFSSIEKMETGEFNYKNKYFKVSKIVDEIIYNSRMLLKEGQQIKYTEKIQDVSLYQDKQIIELILSNLIHNAIKYSPEHSIINLDIDGNDEVTIFKIRDNGIGIPKKDQNNIFERYFRAENVIHTEGTGIGLNIVKDHLDNLDGSISFESEEQQGSTFIVSIPNTAK